MKKLKSFLFLTLLLINNTALSNYIKALPNNDLLQHDDFEKSRVVEKFKKFTLLGDVQAYHRFVGSKDMYHGTGHWLQLRSELRPNKHTALNLRTILYSANSSSGYVRTADFYNLLGINAKLPNKLFGGEASARLLDLGEQMEII